MDSSHFSVKSPLASRVLWPTLAILAALIFTSLHISFMQGGSLPDNDDMMRLQQVRDLLNGQSWFNVSQERLITPEGGAMHWSRLPDLYLAAVIGLLSPVLGQATAETIAVFSWPILLFGWTLIAVTVSLRRLSIGLAGQLFAIGFICLSSAHPNYFPGRIDHHNLVVALSLTAFASLLAPSDSRSSAITAGVCIASMLTVAIESLPYAAGFVFLFGLFWTVRGHREAERLTLLGLSSAIGAVFYYLADAPGWSSGRAVCDAFGTAHAFGLFTGGICLIGLGLFASKMNTWSNRLAAGALAGIITLGCIFLIQPDCFADPYAALPEPVRVAWLEAVAEALPFALVWQSDPGGAVAIYGFVFAAICAALVMIYLNAREQRRLLPAISLLIMLALAGVATIWQVRGAPFSHVFGAMSAGALCGITLSNWQQDGGVPKLAGFALVLGLTAPMAWSSYGRMMFPNPQPSEVSAEVASSPETCSTAAALNQLSQAQPLSILSPIDLGAPVIFQTHHRALAAPYHRNTKGIQIATEVFLSKPQESKQLVSDSGASHLIYCKGDAETKRYAKLAPDGLAAELERDAPPEWLIRVKLNQTEANAPLRFYEVRASKTSSNSD